MTRRRKCLFLSDPGRKRHIYGNPVATENARAHFGDVYNFNQPPFSVLDDSGGPDLMKALSFNGMSDRLMGITPAYAGTCSWILDRPEYLRWRDPDQRSSHHGIFWIKGKAGTGKSTLMSCLHDHDCQQDREGITASFFFNARSPDKLVKSTEGMYRCLLHQILHRLPRLKGNLTHFEVPRFNEEVWPIERLENAFRRVILDISTDERITCFVDALDECNIADVRRAIGHFEDLADSAASRNLQFFVCFSSRYYPHVTMRYHEELKLDVQPEHLQDISRYIDNKLTVPGRAKLELAPKIYDRCSGIFLWVVLVVRQLREESDTGSTRSQLLAILDAIPEELEEVFAKVVSKPDKALTSIVRWMLFTQHRLTTEELYIAVQTTTGSITTVFWDSDEIDHHGIMRYLIHASRGLMEFTYSAGLESAAETPAAAETSAPSSDEDESDEDEDADTSVTDLSPLMRRDFTFIHESVREYFLSDGLAYMDRTSPHKPYAVGHAEIAEGCLDYLELAVEPLAVWQLCNPSSSTEYAMFKPPPPLLWYALRHVFRHAEIALAGGALDIDVLKRFPLQYATTLSVATPELDVYTCNGNLPALLHILADRGCIELARALLARSSPPLDSGTSTHHSKVGTLHTQTHLVRPDPGEGRDYMRLVLSIAIRMHRKDFVKLLLDCGADVDMEEDPYRSPLEEAVFESDCDMLKVLFRHGARINTAKTKYILHFAVETARKEIVQCLLENGVAVNARDDSSQTALHITVSPWRLYDLADAATTAQILIEAGADMEAVDDDGDTVLIKAAGSWQFRLVQFLLEKGASINARNHDRCTALHAAVDVTPLSKFHSHRPLVGAEDPMLEAMLESLLDPGADMSADDRSYSAMFDAAYTAGNVEILIFLARHGVSGEIFSCG